MWVFAHILGEDRIVNLTSGTFVFVSKNNNTPGGEYGVFLAGPWIDLRILLTSSNSKEEAEEELHRIKDAVEKGVPLLDLVNLPVPPGISR